MMMMMMMKSNYEKCCYLKWIGETLQIWRSNSLFQNSVCMCAYMHACVCVCLLVQFLYVCEWRSMYYVWHMCRCQRSMSGVGPSPLLEIESFVHCCKHSFLWTSRDPPVSVSVSLQEHWISSQGSTTFSPMWVLRMWIISLCLGHHLLYSKHGKQREQTQTPDGRRACDVPLTHVPVFGHHRILGFVDTWKFRSSCQSGSGVFIFKLIDFLYKCLKWSWDHWR